MLLLLTQLLRLQSDPDKLFCPSVGSSICRTSAYECPIHTTSITGPYTRQIGNYGKEGGWSGGGLEYIQTIIIYHNQLFCLFEM